MADLDTTPGHWGGPNLDQWIPGAPNQPWNPYGVAPGGEHYPPMGTEFDSLNVYPSTAGLETLNKDLGVSPTAPFNLPAIREARVAVLDAPGGAGGTVPGIPPGQGLKIPERPVYKPPDFTHEIEVYQDIGKRIASALDEFQKSSERLVKAHEDKTRAMTPMYDEYARMVERQEAIPLGLMQTPPAPSAPPVDSERARNFSSIAFAFAALLGRTSRTPLLTMMQSWGGAMQGYLQGRYDVANFQMQQYRLALEEVRQHNQSALAEFQKVMADKKLTMDQMRARIEITAAKYDLDIIAEQARMGDLTKLTTLMGQHQNAFLKMMHEADTQALAAARMDMQWILAQERDAIAAAHLDQRNAQQFLTLYKGFTDHILKLMRDRDHAIDTITGKYRDIAADPMKSQTMKPEERQRQQRLEEQKVINEWKQQMQGVYQLYQPLFRSIGMDINTLQVPGLEMPAATPILAPGGTGAGTVMPGRVAPSVDPVQLRFQAWQRATGGALKPGQTQGQAIAEWAKAHPDARAGGEEAASPAVERPALSEEAVHWDDLP